MTQEQLFSPANLPTGTRHQDQLENALNLAREQGYIIDLDDALVSLARAQATALDQAESDRKYYAVPQIAAPYFETLTALKLVPSARDEANDQVAAALKELSTPKIRNT